MNIDKHKLVETIKKLDSNKLESLTFKILINSLKTTINYAKEDVNDDVYNKFNKFVEKYHDMPSVQNDLNKYFGV